MRAIAYGEKINYSGPIYRSMKVKEDKIVLSFDHVGEGLAGWGSVATAPGGSETHVLTYNTKTSWLSSPLVGFAIAGEDRKFVWAKAEIEGDKVVVSSPQVPKPVAVRYGWADCPVVNLYCSTGFQQPALPASPFRTDDWPMITSPKAEARK